MTQTEFLTLITNLGDSGLMTLLAFLTSAYLYMAGRQRASLAMSVSLLSCLVLMTLLKLGFRSCNHLVPSLNIVSPSGHAAMSAAVFGTIAVIVAHDFQGWRKYVGLILALTLIIGIAASRVILRCHTMNEVLLGSGIGLALAGWAFFFIRKEAPVPFKTRYLAGALLIGLGLYYGQNTPAEGLIIQIADYMHRVLHLC